MDDAIKAVPENGTLKLASDTAVDTPIVIDKPMTIAGNGATVKDITVSNAEVTIDNVTADSITVTGDKPITITNSTISAEKNLSIETSGKVTLSGNTFKDGD